MTFNELIRVLALGFAQDLPYVGGAIKAYAAVVEADRAKEERQREKQEFLDEIGLRIEKSLGRQKWEEMEVVLEQVAVEGKGALLSTSIQVQAEAVHRLETTKPTFQRRFLYLASDEYASPTRTAEIASKYGFLWRKYHADDTIQGVNNVQKIRCGDLIVLAYRGDGDDTGSFFVLTPLIVMSETTANNIINDSLYACAKTHTQKGKRRRKRRNPHRHAPFVLVPKDSHLETLLANEGYDPDQVLDGQCGLNVRTLLSDVTEHATRSILQGKFVSPEPRQTTIWPHNDPKVPPQVTAWIAGL